MINPHSSWHPPIQCCIYPLCVSIPFLLALSVLHLSTVCINPHSSWLYQCCIYPLCVSIPIPPGILLSVLHLSTVRINPHSSWLYQCCIYPLCVSIPIPPGSISAASIHCVYQSPFLLALSVLHLSTTVCINPHSSWLYQCCIYPLCVSIPIPPGSISAASIHCVYQSPFLLALSVLHLSTVRINPHSSWLYQCCIYPLCVSIPIPPGSISAASIHCVYQSPFLLALSVLHLSTVSINPHSSWLYQCCIYPLCLSIPIPPGSISAASIHCVYQSPFLLALSVLHLSTVSINPHSSWLYQCCIYPLCVSIPIPPGSISAASIHCVYQSHSSWLYQCCIYPLCVSIPLSSWP